MIHVTNSIPEGTEIINERSYDTDKLFIFAYYPSSSFGVYCMNDDLSAAMDELADYFEEKGYTGYISETPDDYFDEGSENYQYMQDFYTCAGNHGIVIRMPEIVMEIKEEN